MGEEVMNVVIIEKAKTLIIETIINSEFKFLREEI